MNTALWIVQGLLALTFFATAMFKLTQSKEALLQKMKWPANFSTGQIKLIGLAELLGALGLVVPWLTGIVPVLTPIAAIGLALLMIGASVAHVRLREPPFPLVLVALAIFVALGRLGIVG